MTCTYCGKTRCIHLDPEDDQYVPAVEAKLETTVATPKAGEPLFELCDLRSVRCRLCHYTVPPGPSQVALRFIHGMQHVKAGEAVAVRHGLPVGCVRYEIT